MRTIHSRMPTLDVDKLTEGLSPAESRIVRAAFLKNGRLRTAKPFYRKPGQTPCDMFQGQANYVWRILTFTYCDWSPYSCMPVAAEWDIPRQPSDKMQEIKSELDSIIKRATKNLPIQLERGTLRWGRALGLIN